MDTGDSAWLLAAGALVPLMAPGLALFYGGRLSGVQLYDGRLMSEDRNGARTVPVILFARFQGLFCVITGALIVAKTMRAGVHGLPAFVTHREDSQ